MRVGREILAFSFNKDRIFRKCYFSRHLLASIELKVLLLYFPKTLQKNLPDNICLGLKDFRAQKVVTKHTPNPDFSGLGSA